MFDPENFAEEQIKILEQSLKDKALVACSGGVDSSVCAVLANKVAGDKIKTVFIDDGLMREKEYESVKETLGNLGVTVDLVGVKEEFFNRLKGLKDPEEKRKAFRDTFYRVLGRIIKENNIKYLIQGTIKADILETKEGIKTQHNVLEQIGIDPKTYGFEVLEPLKDLYKHEVREVAKVLGLPEEIHQRMPFPGPGLATRVIGEVTPERTEIVRRATSIVEEEIGKANLKPFQAFAVLMDDKGTGIREGKRLFGNIITVRSVESKDAVKAEPSEIPWEVLLKIRDRVLDEIPSVVRVTYELTQKPPSTIEYI